MISDRKNPRFVRRLETEFSAQDKKYRGISSDLSINGLFIRTQHAFVPDTMLDIVIHLPSASDVKLKGRVRRSIKTPVISIKNGMGIEIIESDPQYVNFVNTVYPDAHKKSDVKDTKPDTSFYKHVNEPPQEFTIIACPQCGVKNKVNNEKLILGPRCGRCKSPLTAQA